MKKKHRENTAQKSEKDEKIRVKLSLVFALDRHADLNTLKETIVRINPKYHSLIKEVFVLAPGGLKPDATFNLPGQIPFIINPTPEELPEQESGHHRICLLNLQQSTSILKLNELFKSELTPVIEDKVTKVLLPDHTNHAQCSETPIIIMEPELFLFFFPYIVSDNYLNWWILRQLIRKEQIETGKLFIDNIRPYVSPKNKVRLKLQTTSIWYKSIPMDFIKKRNIQPRYLSDQPLWRLLFTVASVLLLVTMIFMSTSVGISGDEKVNYRHAKEVYEYFASGGEDQGALNTPKTQLKYYGQSFDNLTYLINKTFNIENEYTSRHILNAITGWLGILFAALTALLIGGWRAAFFTLMLMFLSPRYLGHSFNNPKDIPFAFTYIFVIYFSIRFLRDYPARILRNLLGVAIGISLAISVRIGGLMLVGYLFMFFGLYWLISYTSWLPEVNRKIKHANLAHFAGIAIASVFGYALGLIQWPFALEDPIKNPFEALKVMTNFLASIKQTFEGTIYWSNTLPWYYSLKYMLITIPIIVMAGFLAYVIVQYRRQQPINKFLSFIVMFAWVFPIVYIIYKHSNVYGGWRHLLFSYPPLVILSGLGINGVFNAFQRNKKALIGVTLVVIVGIAPPLQHIVRNHPHTYIYFNAFTGGIRGALGNYEMDYYFTSLKAGSDWFKQNILPEKSDTVIIASNHADILNTYFKNEPVKINYVRYYSAGNTDWDYAIIANANISPYQLKNNIWPPKNTVHTITTGDDVPLCAIIKRGQKEDLRGAQLVQQEKYYEAIPYLYRALQYDTTNTAAALNLTKSLLSIRQNEHAEEVIKMALNAYPTYDKLLNMLGITYMRQGELAKAVKTYGHIIEISTNYISAYFNLGLTYLQMNNNTAALNQFQRAIEINPRYKQAYLMIANIL
ncbi:MAG: tetratricopeptide repeat protein [Bacteroidota bacterium]